MLRRLASRLPSWPEPVVADSAALTPYMSQVVPGCEFLLLTARLMFVRTSTLLMFTPLPACQPLCAPHLAGEVPLIESITATNRPSLPRRSFRSTYSMQAAPAPPNAEFFHRSGSTENCCQRWRSVELPSRLCGVIRFVSGHMAKFRNGLAACDLRKKYWTCEPGVSRPSGMIFVHSFVVASPFQSVSGCGPGGGIRCTVALKVRVLAVGRE